MEFADLSRLIKPNCVAVVGASDKPGTMGRSTMDNLRLNSAVAGQVYLINPRRDHIDGHRCYPDVQIAATSMSRISSPTLT